MIEHIALNGALKRVCRSVTCLLAASLAVAPATLSAQDSDWSLDPDARIELGFVSAQSATRDEQLVVDGDAFTLRTQIGVDFENDDTRFRLEADRIEVVRLGEGRSDSARDRFTATFEQKLDRDWEIQLRGRIYDDFVTAESSDTDEMQGSLEVTYEPKRANRFKLRGTWREREYESGDPVEATGEGPRFDAQYRHRFDRYHYLSFDLRTESIKSDDSRRGYNRQSAKVAYTHPITPDLRVRPAIEYLDTEFDGRLTPNSELRRDQLVVPEVEMLWWPGQWRIEAEAKYIFSGSNQPTREREGYRFNLTVGYVF